MLRTIKRFLPNSVHTRLFSVATKISGATATAKILLSLPLKKQHDKLSFEVHLAEHCNLNCCGCTHFSSIAEHELIDVDEFRRDAERLGELFFHECEEIHLMGGEPLLHPDIIPLMRIARDNFPKAKILIVSNGILLPKKGEDFWRACHDNEIGISVTRYPIKIDEGRIEALAQKFDVNFTWYVSNSIKDFFYKKPIDLSGNGDSRRNFASCIWANRCIQLSHGRLYTCNFIPYVRHFNKKFAGGGKHPHYRGGFR